MHGRWLVETFGTDFLRGGSGVLEISAGKGELACSLRNCYGVPVTAVEPRSLDLRKCHQRLKWSQESAARGVDTLTLDAPALPCCRSPRIVAPRHLRIFWHTGVWKDERSLRAAWAAAHAVRWSSQGLTEMEVDHEKQEAYLDKGVPFRQSTLWADSDEPGL